jgi:hypothetical protein
MEGFIAIISITSLCVVLRIPTVSEKGKEQSYCLSQEFGEQSVSKLLIPPQWLLGMIARVAC